MNQFRITLKTIEIVYIELKIAIFSINNIIKATTLINNNNNSEYLSITKDYKLFKKKPIRIWAFLPLLIRQLTLKLEKVQLTYIICCIIGL